MISILTAVIVAFAIVIFVLFLIGAYQTIRDLKRKERMMANKSSHPNVTRFDRTLAHRDAALH